MLTLSVIQKFEFQCIITRSFLSSLNWSSKSPTLTSIKRNALNIDSKEFYTIS